GRGEDVREPREVEPGEPRSAGKKRAQPRGALLVSGSPGDHGVRAGRAGERGGQTGEPLLAPDLLDAARARMKDREGLRHLREKRGGFRVRASQEVARVGRSRADRNAEGREQAEILV